MADEKDYYKTLGVSKDASREDIKKAYKTLAKKYHPDVNKESGSADKFKEINEAASILGDDQKRKQYDQHGSASFNGGYSGGFDYRDFQGGVNFDDIFETFFGGGAFGGSRRSREHRGADIRYDLEISLSEAAEGLERQLRLRKRAACSSCDGAGGHDVKKCKACHGTGQVRQARQTPFGVFATTTSCRTCGGIGSSFEKPCRECDATGVVMDDVVLDVKIPAGIETGTRLRVSGEGDAGLRGGPGGDLYVFITVKPHQYFEREGDDLRIECPISFVQAALGDEIEVPTLFGKASLKIPPGTQTGTTFRLRDKGMPSVHTSRPGDQLVTVSIETPQKLNKKQREALEEFASASGESVKPQKSLFDKIFK